MTIERVLELMNKKNFTVFKNDKKNYNLNIVGIRKGLTPDKFDDLMCVFWWYKGQLNVRWFEITTDPGLTSLLKPMHSKGTAILAEGQYRSSHKLGKHKGRYTALVQAGKNPLTVYRDNDRNKKFTFVPESKMTGWFGINIHKSSNNNVITKAVDNFKVGPWSYGCQVFAYADEFKDFIDLCEKSAKLWSNSFSYTLIEDVK